MTSKKNPLKDLYYLYENSVQNPLEDIKMIHKFHKDFFGKSSKPLRLKEDFCGTFWLSSEWVKNSKEATALAVDLDSKPLSYGAKRASKVLTKEQLARVRVKKQDVRKIEKEKYDAILANNFSYLIFKQRAQLLAYFKSVKKNLSKKGIFVFDLFGGAFCHRSSVEKHSIRHEGMKWKYLWEQNGFDSMNNNSKFLIHFELANGKKINKKFTYDWRLWSLAEVLELLEESGFKKVVVYEDQEKRGYRQVKTIKEEGTWVVQVVAK